jgi:DNA-binding GntR family transcriptional regulator
MKSIYTIERRYTLTERVVEQIRQAISSGKLKPGDRLMEQDIADAMQIGRNAVREAFRCLEREGFLTITPFKGASITQHEPEEILQMFEAMGELEGTCARLAVLKMTPGDLEKIESLHETLEDLYKAGAHRKYLEVNWALHEFIQKLAGNAVVSKLIDELRQKISLYRSKQLYQPNRFESSITEHRSLLDAFRKKDPEAAQQRMRQHLLRQAASLMRREADE